MTFEVLKTSMRILKPCLYLEIQKNFKIWNRPSKTLLEQRHGFTLRVGLPLSLSDNSVHIGTRRKMRSINFESVFGAGLILLIGCIHDLPAKHVKHFDGYLCRFRQAKFNGRCGVEWIGVVAGYFKRLGQLKLILVSRSQRKENCRAVWCICSDGQIRLTNDRVYKALNHEQQGCTAGPTQIGTINTDSFTTVLRELYIVCTRLKFFRQKRIAKAKSFCQRENTIV